MFVKEKSFKEKYGLLGAALILLVALGYLTHLDFKGHFGQNRGLTFAMLDIGQGDALYIESPTGVQVLVDAGPPRSILGPLHKVMSPFDHSIDMIIVTNPDTDHIGGFFDVIKNYKVGTAFEPGTVNPSKTYQNLENYLKSKNIPEKLARKGTRIDIGGGAYIDMLFPDRDVTDWTTNDGSVVARLVYGDTSVMLTGDATSETEKIILNDYAGKLDELKSTILKVGHHGSRTSSSPEFVKAVQPKYAMISDGKNNKYGHPHKETLDTLAAAGAQILRTDLQGTIVMNSDGKSLKFSTEK